MRDMKKIAKVVKETLAIDFGNVRIIDVRVQDEQDSDGDAVLRVEVVFEGTRNDMDVSKLAGVVRHIRPKLSEIDENAFPVFSFIARGDWDAGRLKSA
jgi:hypothetical protein